jgi:ABC-2 type transport system permease protein
MNKAWIIIKHEYTRHVFRWRFLMGLLSVPLLCFAVIILTVVALAIQYNRSPVGYVDQAKFIKIDALPNAAVSLVQYKFLPFTDEASAHEALEKKKIQAYFVLPPDYQATFRVRQVYVKRPNGQINSQFSDLLALNLLYEQPQNVTQRILAGPILAVQAIAEKKAERPADKSTGSPSSAPTDTSPDADANGSASNRFIRFFIPIAASYILFGAVVSTSGYLTQSVVEEKENRTMEILVTSTSPSAIMNGKIIAMVAIGLTQLMAWCGLPLLGFVILASHFPSLQGAMRWDTLLLSTLTWMATFMLFATLLAMIGATLTGPSEGQQVASMVMLPAMIPYLFINTFIAAPSGPIAMVLTFFPFTAATSLLFRQAFTTVPAWQILVSTGILLFSTAGAFWLAGRVFRFGMLRYGKPIHWKEIIHAIKPQRNQKLHPQKETA